MINVFITSNNVLSVSQIVIKIKKEQINLDPAYQRDFIWSNRFKRDLIISLFKGFPVGYFIFRRKAIDDDKLEVVDGKQRIKTINDFIEGKLELNSAHGNLAKNILNKKTDNSKNKYKDCIKKFSDLNETDRIEFNTIIIPTQEIWTPEDNLIKEYFDRIQNQEQLKAGELISNMPKNSDFDVIFDENEMILKSVLSNINYNDNRKEIVKLLYANFGFLWSLLDIGSKDENIIKFCRQLTLDDYLTKNSLEIPKIKNYFERTINFFKRIESKIDVGIAKKRFIKMFLLFSHFWKINSIIEIEKIGILNKLLSDFNTKTARKNSNKFKSITEQTLSLTNDEYLYFEQLYYIFVGSHTFEGVRETLEFWARKTSKAGN